MPAVLFRRDRLHEAAVVKPHHVAVPAGNVLLQRALGKRPQDDARGLQHGNKTSLRQVSFGGIAFFAGAEPLQIQVMAKI